MMNQHLCTLSAIAVSLLAPCVFCCAQDDAEQTSPGDAAKAEIVSINTVGPRAERQSDADIVHYKGHFYVAYAKKRKAGESAIHVLQSIDGRDWKLAATLRSAMEELRPDITHAAHYAGRPVWFSRMPSGRLCVTARASRRTVVWSTDDGADWREELDLKLSRSYSRVHWRNDRAYCVSDESSSCGEKFEFFRLESAEVDSAPKTVYKLSHNSHTLTGPRESQLVLSDDRAVCLLSFETYNFDKARRWLVPSGEYATGKIGVSTAPYTEWTWTPSNLEFGHPNLLVLKDKRTLATVFIDGDDPHSALCQVDALTGKLSELLRLPTAATRQPIGMTEHDGNIWTCFYDGPQDRKNDPTLKVAKIKLQQVSETIVRDGLFSVSAETTFVTEPLLPDGYVDFASAINQQFSIGVTEDNNAVIPLMLAIGPRTSQIDRHDFLWGPDQITSFQEQAGLPVDFLRPSGLDQLRPTNHLRKHFQTYEHPDKRFDEIFRLLHEAAGRTRFYEPLITVSKPGSQPQLLLGASYPNDFAIQDAAKLLLTRAVAAKDRRESWEDILASYRLGRLVSAGPEVSDAVLGYSIERESIEAATKLFSEVPLSVADRKRYLSDLEALPKRATVKSKVNLAERCKCLDALIYLPMYAKHDGNADNRGWSQYPGALPGIGHGLGVIYGLIHEHKLAGGNWDAALRQVNGEFDEAVTILALSDAKQRNAAIIELKQKWQGRRLPIAPPDRGEFSSLPPWESDPVLFNERSETLEWLGQIINTGVKTNQLDLVFESAGKAAAGMVLPTCFRAFATEEETEQSALKLPCRPRADQIDARVHLRGRVSTTTTQNAKRVSMSKLSQKSKNFGPRFIVMALVGLLLLLVAMPGYHMFESWRRYQQQRQDIITIRKGRKHPTRFEFQGPRNERYKIPAWRPFAEELDARVKRIRVHLTPNDKVQFEKLSHFNHLEELELTIETPFRLELPAELTDLSSVTELTLAGDELGDLSRVTALTKLTSLTLVAPNMPEMPDLTGLNSLKRVELVADRLSPADWAHKLPPLESLLLLSNQVGDLTSIAEHTETRLAHNHRRKPRSRSVNTDGKSPAAHCT